MNSISFLGVEIILSVFALIIFSLSLITKKTGCDSASAPKIACLGFLSAFAWVPVIWGKVGFLFNHAFRSDSFELFFKAFFLTSGFLVSLIANDYQIRAHGKRSAEFYLLLITAILGACFLVSANDFLTFFISLELLTISAYILSAYPKTDVRALEAGGKYLVVGAFSSAVMLFGIAFLYGSFGSLSFEIIQQKFSSGIENQFTAYFGIFLVLAGLGFKISAFPFQLWVPDVYEGSPTPLTAFLAVISKGAGFGALIRLFFGVFSAVKPELTFLFVLIATATLLYGNLGAIPQINGNFKRLLAFSGISHAGYLLIGIASGSGLGVAAILYYLLVYGTASLIIFLVLVQLAPDESITSLKGLFGRSSLLGSVLFIALLSLAGVPPLGGFFAKYMIIQSAVSQNLMTLAFLGALNIMISLYYYLMVIKIMYVQPASEFNTEKTRVSSVTKTSILTLTSMLVFFGIFQDFFLRLISQALS